MRLELAAYFAITTGNVLSIVGCVWLFLRLQRLDGHLRTRVFPRQLMSLAIADIAFHSWFAIASCVDFVPGFYDNFAWRLNGCGSMAIFTALRVVSSLNEMCIALTFLLQALHVKGYVGFLQKYSIPLTWIGGLVCLPVEFLIIKWRWNPEAATCKPTVQKGWVSILTLSACAIVCFASYIIVVGRSLFVRTPGNTSKLYFRRAAVYPLNFFLTYGVVLFLYYEPSMYKGWTQWLGATMESLGGFLNVITYALQSRYANTLRDPSATLRVGRNQACELTFHPEMRSPTVVDVSFLEWQSGPAEEDENPASASQQ